MYIFLIIVGLLFVSVVVNKLLWKEEITFAEMAINLIIMIALLALFWVASISNKISDVEILNGEVTDKIKEEVHCRHSYRCKCYTTCSSGKNRVCSTHCSTCYRHSFDNDWVVESNIGNYLIDSLDSQGLQEPPRWTIVRKGDPVSKEHNFDNYIKGSETSIFGRKISISDKELEEMPNYPNRVFDYYKVNRVIDLTNVLSDEELKKANEEIAEMLKTTGFHKQANAIIILSDKTEDFALKLIENWYGGKKNDVIIIIGLKGKEINWARVHSWSIHNIFEVELRDAILNHKYLDMSKVIKETQFYLDKDYVRRSFKEFEYLRWQIMPSNSSLWIFIILSLLCSTTLGFFMSRNEICER
jgi:hypothetical protein